MVIFTRSLVKTTVSWNIPIIRTVRRISLVSGALFVIIEAYGLVNTDKFVSNHNYLFLFGVLYFGICAVFEWACFEP